MTTKEIVKQSVLNLLKEGKPVYFKYDFDYDIISNYQNRLTYEGRLIFQNMNDNDYKYDTVSNIRRYVDDKRVLKCLEGLNGNTSVFYKDKSIKQIRKEKLESIFTENK